MESSEARNGDPSGVESSKAEDLRKAKHNDLLVGQIRAFLEASEDVDLDEETLQDLISSIPSEYQLPSAERSVSVDSDHSDDSSSVDGPSADNQQGEADYTAFFDDTEDETEPWSVEEIKPMMRHLKEHGVTSWVKEYVLIRNIPVLRLLRAFGVSLCPELRNKKTSTLVYFLKVALSREIRFRERLTQYSTISDAADLIRKAQKIIILTGAGISVSCGIPDFRSRNGLYASLKDRGEYDLDDPQQMFDINYFRENPAVFYSFASQIYPANFTPSPCHRFIKLVEDKNQLLRNYTQNIDTLETQAGVRRVLQCHGSFATATCLLCRRRVPGSDIEHDIMNQKVALCTACNATEAQPTHKKKKRGRKKAKGLWDSDDEDESDRPLYPPSIMKPDITFFGEKLTDEFDKLLAEDRSQVDLLLVIGTSLKVSPVADILSHLPHSVPQILINKTPVRHINPDIVLLGNADDIIEHLCGELGWNLPSAADKGGRTPAEASRSVQKPQRVGNSHVWLFEGAEGGKWVQDILKREEEQQIAAETKSNLRISESSSSLDASGKKRDLGGDHDVEERSPKKAKAGQVSVA